MSSRAKARSPAQRAAIAAAISRKKMSGYGTYKRGTKYPARRPASTARPRALVKGRGAYKKDYGSRLGSVVGEGLQELLTQINPMKLIGFGDYSRPTYAVKENTLLANGMDPPEIRNAKDGRFILRHREFLGDVITGSAGVFKNTSYRIQPGLAASFPWLAPVAQQFEQYVLRGMIWEFKSTSSDALNSTNTALGTVIMATEYDSTQPNFTNKQAMENHNFASSARQSCSMLHPIECARSQTVIGNLYTRSAEVPDGADPRLFDFGNFQIATVGQQGSNVNIGELWVTYEIELLKPQLDAGGPALSDHFWSPAATTSNYFGANPDSGIIRRPGSDLGVTLGAATITFPPSFRGNVLLVYAVLGSTPAAVTQPTITATSGCTGIAFFGNLLFSTVAGPQAGATATQLVAVFAATITADNAVVTFSGGALPGSVFSMDLAITMMSNTLLT